MCIKIYCKYCKELIPTTDMRRHICDKPECQVAKRKDEKIRYNIRNRIELDHTHCKICGKELRVGDYRSKYCSDACSIIGKMVRQRVLRKLKGEAVAK